MGTFSGDLLVERGVGQGWWLVADADDGLPGVRVVAGPFTDEADARWALLEQPADGPPSAHVQYGVRRADGAFRRRPSPQQWQWLDALNAQLERLPAGWDDELDDEDPLVTLVVEVAAGFMDAGLTLHDCAGVTGPDARSGGVCLTPDAGQQGVVVSWHQHDRMSVERVRGAEAEAAVGLVMGAATADLLVGLGFSVEPFGDGGAHLVRVPHSAA